MAGMLRIVGPRGVYRFGRAFGMIEWFINYKRRQRFAEAMREFFPEAMPPSRLRKESLRFVQASRCNKLFNLVFDSLSRAQAESLVHIERRELLDDALRRGRGVYIAMSHHGPYQIGGLFLSLMGYRMAAVRDRNEGGLTRYIQQRFDQRYPEFTRMKVFYSDTYPRVIYRCLSEGYVLGSAIDVTRLRHANLRTETVTVFGRQRRLLSGPLRIAIRCGVPVLQAFVVPERDFHYRILFHGPLYDPAQGLPEEEAVRHAMRIYVAHMEAHIRRWPRHITRV